MADTKPANPLTVEVEGNQLRIVIGVETLAHALATSHEFETDEGSRLTIPDPVAFAKAMARELGDQEDESGETPLTNLLLKICGQLIEMGDLTVRYQEVPIDRTPPDGPWDIDYA
jgi:hypothetical protein